MQGKEACRGHAGEEKGYAAWGYYAREMWAWLDSCCWKLGRPELGLKIGPKWALAVLKRKRPNGNKKKTKTKTKCNKNTINTGFETTQMKIKYDT